MKRRNHLKLTAPIGLIALIAAGLTCWREGLLYTQDPVQAITVVAAQHGNLFSAVTASGMLEPRRTVDIKYDAESPVDELLVHEGDHVNAGQVLAVMDTSILNHSLNEAREVMEKDQTVLVETKGQLERAEALAHDQLIAVAELDLDRANCEALVHQTHADAQSVMQIQGEINRATLRSPINGVVIAVYVHQGEMLGSAAAVAALGPADAVSKPTNTLMTLAESGPLVVDAYINEVDLGGVRTGQKMEFVADAFRPKVFHGRVSHIALQPTVINNVTTYRTTIAISDPDPRFRIGLPVNVMLLTEGARNALLAPQVALVQKEQGFFVDVFHPAELMPNSRKATSIVPDANGRIERVKMRVLSETNLAAAIKGPLQGGDWIVVKGTSDGSLPQRFLVTLRAFKPNPTFEDFDFTAGQHETSRFVPGPRPAGLLDRLLGH
jgi:HlyD family secretion protein